MRAKPAAAAALAAFIGVGIAQSETLPDENGLIPEATIAEIMESMVMPAAQALWEAVGVDVTEHGEVTTAPETDEEWAKLRAAAITLAEAANAVMVPGRHAAPPTDPAPAEGSGELTPAAMEKLLVSQRPAWVAHAQVLHATAMQALAAVDARNVDAISEVGGAIDEACEGCHLQFWYPEQR